MGLFNYYLKFVITPKDPPPVLSCEVQQPRNAFQLMMSVQLTKHVPGEVTEHNGRDRMKNKLFESLEQKQLGWSPDGVQSTGGNFVDHLTDVL